VAAGAPSRLAGQVLELEAERRTGEVFPIDLLLSTYRSTYRVDGEPNFTSFIRDTSDRRRAEAELRTSEARYRALTEHSPEPIYLHRDGHVLYANPARARLLGAPSPAALVGARVMNVFHPDDYARAERDLALLTRGEPQPELFRYRLLRHDGTAVEVESISALVDVDGAPACRRSSGTSPSATRSSASSPTRRSTTRSRASPTVPSSSTGSATRWRSSAPGASTPARTNWPSSTSTWTRPRGARRPAGTFASRSTSRPDSSRTRPGSPRTWSGRSPPRGCRRRRSRSR